ncbi:MAG: hypothetical protein RBT60_06905 [Candidatus Krumholzibacteria bacterium]|nr:hypothetical protein [Candidatus Krumholzibacteria bacterium]
MGRRQVLPTLTVLLLVLAGAAVSAPDPVRVFSQHGMARGLDGRPLTPVVLDPDSRDDLTELSFDLGRGRVLVLRTNLSPERRHDIADLAAAVRRCHDFVEHATERRVQGDMLLYLMTFSAVPRAYTFRVELDAGDRWSQIRLALLNDRETLTGATASLHLQHLLYATLPHELGHHLINAEPTVLQDIDNRPSYYTRWFTEGVCEILAFRFAQQECPAHAWRILRDRRIDRVLKTNGLRGHLLGWAQSDRHAWDLESDLYGGAMLLVMEWLQWVPLPDLLASLAATGGQHDGTVLLERLCRTTSMTVAEIFEHAAQRGSDLLAPLCSLR